MTTQSSQSVLINGFGVLFVILNSFGLGLRLSVGKLLAEAFAHWKIAVWALVINFVIIPLLFIGYLLTIASSIPDEIKVGFCVAALCAGMPFAPLLARLAKADVSIATTLLVVLSAGTIIALPLGLPLAIDAVDAQLKTSAWDVAWPLLLFLLLPLVLGCGFRVWWPDLTPPLAQWVLRVAILCLLFNLNFTLVAYWDLFEQTWGTESYIAAFAGPFIGLGCGYLLVSSLRVKDVANQACDRGDHGGTQHRSDAPDDDLSLCSRPAGHGVDHDPQHRRHHDRPAVRPDVEARCFTIGHPRSYVSCRAPRSGDIPEHWRRRRCIAVAAPALLAQGDAAATFRGLGHDRGGYRATGLPPQIRRATSSASRICLDVWTRAAAPCEASAS